MSVPYLKPREDGMPDAWTSRSAEAGHRGGQRVIEAGEVAAPPEVAHLLGVATGDTVVVRRRLIDLDGVPCELTDTYYPVSIARGTRLARPGRIPGGAVTEMAKLGHVGRRVVEEVTARMPEPAERELLATGPEEPVLEILRSTLDDKDRPIQADRMVMPSTRQRLRYEIRID